MSDQGDTLDSLRVRLANPSLGPMGLNPPKFLARLPIGSSQLITYKGYLTGSVGRIACSVAGTSVNEVVAM